MGKYIGINLRDKISESELILNSDGSVYHIRLLPEHVADDVIVVGDPARVELISSKFDRVDFKIYNREFITHTGSFNNKRITVIATGIGTDNIDIVLNELDAAVNIDLQTRQIKEQKRSLNIIRIGTSGALQADIPVDSFVVSSYGLGFDGLLHFYAGWENINEKEITQAFIDHSKWKAECASPYVIKGSEVLINKLGKGIRKGITATACGFYAPQGRKLRAGLSMPQMNELLTTFNHKQLQITNFEMETSALYGLGTLLGHNTCTVCAIIANRIIKEYSRDYKLAVDKLIDHVLEKLTS
ncbi:MAG: nucleoside phosphorylase [Bacteroidetes bacterium]|nr:nucleoside phosphorylase [Bacteroidota bacterium]HET6244954.1 nucleoside phosphorylase [Bacteroidia bacterium]